MIAGLTLIGLRGGNIAFLTFERLSSKNYWSQWSITFWQFLNMYMLWLQTNKIVICTLTGLLGGVSNLSVKIFFAYFWTYLHFFWVLFIFDHVSCLNIPNFGHWFHFWGNKIEALWLLSLCLRAPVSKIRSTKHIH